MAEMSKPDKRYAGKGDKKPEPKGEPEKKPGPMAEGDKKPDEPMDARGAMMKRHEKEARDLHGQHRDAMRDMHNRQMAEMSAQNAQMSPGAQAPQGAGAEPEPVGGAEG